MSGWVILSQAEKGEMLHQSPDEMQGQAFRAALIKG